MSDLNIYKIKDLALKSRRRVYTIRELSNLINKSYTISKVYLNRLVSAKFATKVMDGVITFSDFEMVTGTQLIEPSYVSFEYSLNFHKLIQQVPTKLILITTRKTRRIKDYTYKHVNPSLFFGYCKEAYDGSYIFIADPEKAVLDMVYLDKYPFEIFDDFLHKLDKKKIKTYISKYKLLNNNRIKRIVEFGDYFDRQRRIIRNNKI